ncbi:MAG: hypothetical protein IKF36_03445 [Bacilli bacterium]|nr:hypothetical protein [Bacilli bacterium]
MNYQDKLLNTFGDNNYNYIISKHNDVITKLSNDNHIDEFIKLYNSYSENLDFLNSFYAAVRVIFKNHYQYTEKVINNRITRVVPSYFSSMNFVIKSEILHYEDIEKISMNNIMYSNRDEIIIDKIGLDNIMRFEKETGYFSKEIHMGFTIHKFFSMFLNYINNNQYKLSNRIPSYEEFLDIMEDYFIFLKRNKENGVYLDIQEFPISFKKKYKDLFIDEEADEEYRLRFYLGELDLSYIKDNLGVISYIKDKTIENVLFDNISIINNNTKYSFYNIYSIKFGNEALIELITSFADLLTLLNNKNIDFNLDKEAFDKQIRDIIYTELKSSKIKYDFLANSNSFNAILFKGEHNDLFLDEDAPNDLKNAFYDGLSFKYISNNRRYIKYIKNKDYITSIIKKEDIRAKEFFDILKDDAFRLILNNPDTISKALKEDELNNLCFWYLKTGRTFIPEYEVIKFFDTKEADRFIINKNKWKSLLKSLSFREDGNREVLIRLAYLFGVFHDDDQGYNKLKELILGVPKHIYKKDSIFITSFSECLDDSRIQKIKKSLIKEGFNITQDDFIYDLYKENKDGSYTLMINMQEYPKSNLLLRDLMEECELSNVLTPSICNDLFYNFKLSYNKEFKDLFSHNIREIIKDNVCRYYISIIQRKFDEIKKFHSNRKLTLEMCINYVRNNSLENVGIGNEILADHLSKLGFSQEKYDELQAIYNIGKQRIFSSIPRVTGKVGNYRYEMVRLDCVLPLIVGELIPCCQRLGQLGETCMIHSMLDKNGRLFVVFDENNNLISESWVWRNKDVLCFDNIEVPTSILVEHGYKKAFFDRGMRTSFGDKLLEVYLEASKDIYLTDKEKYDELLETGQITKEQYEDLVLKKITIGDGYSSIQGSLQANLNKDLFPEKPLTFVNPITKDNFLYIRDSRTQYLVLNRKEKKSTNKTLHVYHDDFKIIDKNISELEIFKIKREEQAFRENSILLYTNTESKQFFKDLNNIYNSSNIKIMSHACFTIIYEQTDIIKIKDIFYNKDIDQKTISKFLKLALLQLKQIANIKLEDNVKQVLSNITKTKKLKYVTN